MAVRRRPAGNTWCQSATDWKQCRLTSHLEQGEAAPFARSHYAEAAMQVAQTNVKEGRKFPQFEQHQELEGAGSLHCPVTSLALPPL